MKPRTPDEVAQKLHDLITSEQVPNSYYNDNNNVSCKTADFDKLFPAVTDLIKSSADLTGSHEGIPTTAMVKYAIMGEFANQVNNPGSSVANYEMIQHLYDATKDNVDFWGKTEPEPDRTQQSGKLGYYLWLNSRPAASLAGQRMTMETFSMSIRGEGLEAMATAHKLSKSLRHIPAFQEEVRGIQRLCNLQESYENRIPERKEIEAQIKDTAKALHSMDFARLSRWHSGPAALDIEAAIKLHVFVGDSGSPVLEDAIKLLKTPARPQPAKEKIEMEIA